MKNFRKDEIAKLFISELNKSKPLNSSMNIPNEESDDEESIIEDTNTIVEEKDAEEKDTE